MKINNIYTIYIAIMISNSISFAGLKTSEDFNSGAKKGNNGILEGVKTFSHNDSCIIPEKYNLNGVNATPYSDHDLEKEEKLCKMDLNNKPLCPKLNSTNPGTLVLSEKDENDNPISAADTTDSFCKAKEYDVKAKFKQSITCSYTASALAAYHLSRILGTQITTPVSVARSMDKNRHSELIDQALRILNGRENEIIYKSWSQFSRANSTANEPKLYLNSNGDALLYGALSENLKHESIYTEVSGVGPYDTRYTRFKEQLPYKRVTTPGPVKNIIGTDANNIKSLPALQQMLDVSNMIVLDTLLNQDDRIGNIHFYLTYARLSEDGKIEKKRLNKDEIKAIESSNKKFKSLSRWKEQDIADATKIYIALKKKSDSSFNGSGILLREMVLKDNDCGVDVSKRSNNMKKIEAIKELRHISPETYYNLLRLHKEMLSNNGNSLKNYFTKTLLYNENDFDRNQKGFVNNLKYVVQSLKENCESKDPENHLSLDLGVQYTSENGIQYSNNVKCDL